MKLIVGLGNPGKEYQNTRHNVGFLYLDFLAQKSIFKDSKKFNSEIVEFTRNNEKYILLKPQTFMNRSGEAVVKVKNFYKLNCEDIYIVHDDLDIKFGSFKIQKGTGPKVHNGILSLEEALGTHDFWRIRVGVDNRRDAKIPGQEYVLDRFTSDESKELLKIFDGISAGLMK